MLIELNRSIGIAEDETIKTYLYDGYARVQGSQSNLSISLQLLDAPRLWQFGFYAPSFALGTRFTNVIVEGVTEKSYENNTDCNVDNNSYTIEHLQPNLVIRFKYLQCHELTTPELIGKITVIPFSVMTVTPAVPPQNVLQLRNGPGLGSVELNSENGDRYRRGKGLIKVEGFGKAEQTAEKLEEGYSLQHLKISVPVKPDLFKDRTSNAAALVFSFDASSFIAGQTYQVSGITHYYGGYPLQIQIQDANTLRPYFECARTQGSFTVETVVPTLSIAFNLSCAENATHELHGKISFMAQDATAIPTTDAKKIITLSSARGKFVANLNVSSANRLGTTLGMSQGNFAWQGTATLDIFDKQFVFTIAPESARNLTVQFRFGIPALPLQADTVYNYNSDLPPDTPNALITIDGMPDCRNAQGIFSFTLQGIALQGTFKLICNRNQADALSGTLAFTSDTTFTPTPTVPFDKLIQFYPGNGLIKAELYSEPGDKAGEGKKEITIEEIGGLSMGDGRLYFYPTNGKSVWAFDFYAPLYEKDKVIQASMGRSVAPGASYLERGYAIIFARLSNYLQGSDSCHQPIGSFKVAQKGKGFRIEFSQRCQNSLNAEFRGTITFTPLSELTPTATIPPPK